jgi:hypothetical protein
MRPVIVSVGPLAAASANNIATSQTVSGAAAVTLNGSLVNGNGVAVLDNPRQILITNVGNDSGITFTVKGTSFTGGSISQTVTGTNGSTVATTLDFATVTSITTSGSTSASGITVGTNAVAGSSWVRFDDFAPSNISIQCDVSGTVNYTVQSTLNDPNSPTNPVEISSVNWISSSDSAVVNQTATAQSNFNFSPCYARILLNGGTGSVTATFLQSSNGPY